MKVHYSHKRSDWGTPIELFNELNQKYGPFDIDVCANDKNAKCTSYYTEKDDALKFSHWVGRCFMNPPYGREIGKWIHKAWHSAEQGSLVVCLLPARTDTKWFHEYALKGQIHFLKGRLKFEGAQWSAPFPSMIVVFQPNPMGSIY